MMPWAAQPRVMLSSPEKVVSENLVRAYSNGLTVRVRELGHSSPAHKDRNGRLESENRRRRIALRHRPHYAGMEEEPSECMGVLVLGCNNSFSKRDIRLPINTHK